MTINYFKRLRTISVLLSLFVFSCRSTDTDDHLVTGGVASVKINFTGAAYEDPAVPQTSVKTSEARKKTVLIDPGTLIEVEMVSVTSTADKSTRASVTQPLDGASFRVIIYEKATGNYKIHKDYSILNGNLSAMGGGDAAMMLDGGISYTVITYSYGILGIPDISAEEKTNIANAQLAYNYIKTQDFMYEKQELTPVGGRDNILKILLKHKVAEVTVNLNVANNNNIEKIENAAIAPHFNSGTISLTTGNIMPDNTPLSVGVVFDKIISSNKRSAPVLVNANTAGTSIGTFSADVTIGGNTKNINTGSFFTIIPGTRKNLNISILNTRKCGAYLGPNQTQWADFMCYNLGADINADPFLPSAAIHGAKYQWGAQTGEAGSYYSQSDDQSNSGTITGWNTVAKPNGTWSDAGKTVNDPCPAGYRVPTSAQWQSVIDNNPHRLIGPWGAPANYNSGEYFGDHLFLPATGLRMIDGTLINVGYTGSYWSITVDGTYANHLFLHKTSNFINSSSRQGGMSVRCIKE